MKSQTHQKLRDMSISKGRRTLGLLTLGLATLVPFSATYAEPQGNVVPSGSTSFTAADEIYSVPVVNIDGETLHLQTRVCEPAGTGPFRAVLLNHGSPPNPSDKPTMQIGHCGEEAAQWFLRRGFAVVFALRRGYGATGGDWAESYKDCSTKDYVSAGLETARDIDAVVNYVTTLPHIKPTDVVVVGQSAGGWGTIAYDSMPHSKVSTFIDMAGGRGGHQHNQPNSNCHSDNLIEAAGKYGATATTPMLWIYTDNDTYFGPSIAEEMHKAFESAGGKAEFVDPGPYSNEGHRLFFGQGGSAIWGPIVEKCLSK